MLNVLSPVLYIIVSIGMYFTYISPAIDKVYEYRDLSSHISEVTNDFEQLLLERDMLIGKYNIVSPEDEAQLKQIVPDETSPIRFIIDIDKMTTGLNFTITSFDLPWHDLRTRVQGQNGLGDLMTSKMKVQFEGEYVDFKKFLRAIESSSTLNDVVGLEIESLSMKEGEKPRQAYNITMNVYWLST